MIVSAFASLHNSSGVSPHTITLFFLYMGYYNNSGGFIDFQVPWKQTDNICFYGRAKGSYSYLFPFSVGLEQMDQPFFYIC